LNFDKINISSRLDLNETMGLIIVNVVRKLSLKSFIRIVDEQDKLTRLQYAFLLERNQRCKLASEKYKELEADLHESDDLAFVMLHGGYCLAITGEKTKAIEKLDKIIKSNPGTHFSDSAEILISILLESEKKKKEIQANFTDDHQIAKAYYQAGQYSEAFLKFDSIQSLSMRERYMKARSMEKIGKTQEAITEYFSLSEQKEDLPVAKEANRRLLVLGKIYDAGEKVTKIAEKKADQLKDTQLLSLVKEGADLKLQSIVMEKIKKEEAKPVSRDEQKNPEEQVPNIAIKNEMEIVLPKSIEKRVREIEKLEEEPKSPANRMVVYLSDGRIIKGMSFIIRKSEVVVDTTQFEMSFPLSMLERVDTEGIQKKQKSKGFIDLMIGKANYSFVDSIEKREEDLIIKRKGKEESFAALDLKSAKVK
ncbi:MAG: CDC27 family protein, partial [Leptospira sp.]|nr:CDC27 family protein [Leptospira sp.]